MAAFYGIAGSEMKHQNDRKTFDHTTSDEEALRLTLAFYCIMEPEKRAIVLALAERYAGQVEPGDVPPVDPEARTYDQ
jgi:hypothetical protein